MRHPYVCTLRDTFNVVETSIGSHGRLQEVKPDQRKHDGMTGESCNGTPIETEKILKPRGQIIQRCKRTK